MSMSSQVWRVAPVVLVCWAVSTIACSDATSPLGNHVDTANGALALGNGDTMLVERRDRGQQRAASVSVALDENVVAVGETVTAAVVAQTARGDTLRAPRVHWTSKDWRVATVSDEGIVTARRVGTADILASVGNVVGSTTLTVVRQRRRVVMVNVALAAATIAVGTTTQATAVLLDSAGNVVTGRTVRWKSTTTAIATIDSLGTVTAVAPGTTTIAVRYQNNIGSAALTVVAATTGPTPVASVTVTLASPEIRVGGATQATAVALDATGATLTGRAVAWSTSNPAAATVDGATGIVTGTGIGSATIAATTEGKTGSAAVTVTAVPVASVGVTLAASSITVGATTQATAIAVDSSGGALTGRAVAWTTSNPAVATIDAATGVVSGISVGTTRITATCEGKSASAVLTVAAVPVASVTVSLASSNISAGATTRATAVTLDADGNALTGRSITWSSSNTAVATVDPASGVVTGGGAGTATITATSEGKTGSATLTVAPVTVARVSVTLSASSITVGATTQAAAIAFDASDNQLTGRAVSWSSSNVAVATVNPSTGVVTGAGVGSATISATCEGNVGTATVTVTPVPVASVTVSLATSSLVVGATTQAIATAYDAAGNQLTGRAVAWSSSNTAVATIDGSTGVVSAIAVGTATISATSGGQTGTAIVAVTDVPVAKVTVGLAASNIVAGASTQATATLTDANGNPITGRVVAWSSSAAAVATVSPTGLVTGVSAGSANVVATSDGKSGQATVTVAAPPPVASRLMIITQPSNTEQSGQPLAQQPVVQLQDGSNTPVAQAGVVVAATIASGGGTLGGNVSAITNANGVATFSNLSITGSTGSRTLGFSSPPLAGATSSSIMVTSPPTQLVLTTQPGGAATSGVALAPQPVVQLADGNGGAVSQAGVVVTAALASGSGTLSGTTTVTTNGTGTAAFTNLVITGTGAQTLQFTASGLTSVRSNTITVTTAGSFATPNILNNASFETGWDGFTDWSENPPPFGDHLARDNTQASQGSWSVVRSWTPNPSSETGSQMLSPRIFADRVWVRFYFKLTAPITSIWKFMRFTNTSNGGFGGIFMQSGSNLLGFGWDAEGSVVTTIGLTQAQVIDGQWHSLEVEYWRNGDPSGWPSAAFWFDGAPQAMPDGSIGVGNLAFWRGGRLYAGERASNSQVGWTAWLGTLNIGNATTGQVNIDRIAISSVGRIGP